MRNPEAMITTMYRWILIKSCENYSTSTHFQFPNMKLVGSLVLRIGNRYVEKDALKSTNHGTISEWGIEHYVAKANHNLGTEIFDCYGMKFHKLRPALICIAHPGLDSWRWKTPITRHRNPPNSEKNDGWKGCGYKSVTNLKAKQRRLPQQIHFIPNMARPLRQRELMRTLWNNSKQVKNKKYAENIFPKKEQLSDWSG